MYPPKTAVKESPNYWHSCQLAGIIMISLLIGGIPLSMVCSAMGIATFFGLPPLLFWQICAIWFIDTLWLSIWILFIDMMTMEGATFSMQVLIGGYVVIHSLCILYFAWSIGWAMLLSSIALFTVVKLIADTLVLMIILELDHRGIHRRNWFFIAFGRHELQSNIGSSEEMDEKIEWATEQLNNMWYCERKMGLWCFMNYDDMVMFKLMYGGVTWGDQ